MGELETNVCMAAEYLMLLHFLEIEGHARRDKVARYILDQQRPDGTWPIYHGGPPDINATVESYFALKLAGVPASEPRLLLARAWVLSRGGVPKARVFTRIWLALFGQWDWRGVPVLPPELMFAPHWFPLNIYDFASWARATIVPMLIILNEKPVCPVPETAHIDELYPTPREETRYEPEALRGLSWKRVFHEAEKVVRRYDPGALGGLYPAASLRRKAYAAAEDWIVAHQEADGSWAGIQPPWVYSLIALKLRGYDLDHPVMKRGIEAFDNGLWSIEKPGMFNPQACLSPVWDTALAMIALLDSGLPADHPALQAGGTWLLREQVLTGGDWQVRAPGVEPGGWSFEFENDIYPDTDDTAEVLIALHRTHLPDERRKRAAIARGKQWLLGMQSSNGGWGAFDRNNTRSLVNEIPFCDFGEVIDPPSEDVTAHVIEALCLLGEADSPSVQRGLNYLRRTQRPDGSWFGRWGVNYVYGTGGVLPAFESAGRNMSASRFTRAAAWLRSHQNADGGWGESCRSYEDPALSGAGESTASQTAWGMLGLLAVNSPSSADSPAGTAARWLVERQEEDGQWLEPQFTGTGFPGDFYIKYHLYRNYWPLMALGRFRSLSD
jgi:squalene-hopene/tetraprenyl-beta-curcumene cyclase